MNFEPTIFVVDDDPAVRKAVRFLLQVAGFKVELYSTARDFLDAYDETQPGCLILDIRMPGMDGFELQEELAARQSPLPIIFITGHGNTGAKARALDRGAVGFIAKPFDNQVLLKQVHHALYSYPGSVHH
jgi:two-component system response regulator FixJ